MKKTIKNTVDFFKSKYNYHLATRKAVSEDAVSSDELEELRQQKTYEARFEEVREMIGLEKQDTTLSDYLKVSSIIMTGAQVGLLTRDFEVCSEYWEILLVNGLGNDKRYR